MFGLIKLIIWICGLAVVAYFVLGYFGYEVNREYFSTSKAKCEEKVKECGSNVVHQGTDNVKCDFNCVDPKIIIKKK
jgi:hypothetical protein